MEGERAWIAYCCRGRWTGGTRTAPPWLSPRAISRAAARLSPESPRSCRQTVRGRKKKSFARKGVGLGFSLVLGACLGPGARGPAAPAPAFSLLRPALWQARRTKDPVRQESPSRGSNRGRVRAGAWHGWAAKRWGPSAVTCVDRRAARGGWRRGQVLQAAAGCLRGAEARKAHRECRPGPTRVVNKDIDPTQKAAAPRAALSSSPWPPLPAGLAASCPSSLPVHPGVPVVRPCRRRVLYTPFIPNYNSFQEF
jgi:hypothetical protein